MDGELGRLGQLSTAKNSTLDTALVRTPLVFEVPDLRGSMVGEYLPFYLFILQSHTFCPYFALFRISRHSS